MLHQEGVIKGKVIVKGFSGKASVRHIFLHKSVDVIGRRSKRFVGVGNLIIIGYDHFGEG
jgi:hypothetical protein